jgi:hypothetical protein
MKMVTRMSTGRQPVASIRVLALCAALMLAGCSASQHRSERATSAEHGLRAPSNLPAGTAGVDPMELMRQTLVRCDALAGYQIVFHRQERRGLLNQLGAWEDIDVFYRKRPHSIRMTWLNADSEYAEAVYVEGVNESKVTVLARKGLFGLPASAVSVPPEMAVQMGKTLRPISDFGLAAMVRRTLSQIEKAQQAGGATVTCEGVATVEKLGTRARHIVIFYPQGFTRAARQDLYINVETGYPDGTYLWLPNGDLLAAYLYERPVPAMPGDELFVVSKTRTLAKKE